MLINNLYKIDLNILAITKYKKGGVIISNINILYLYIKILNINFIIYKEDN